MAVHRNRPPGADDGRAERNMKNEIQLLYRPDRESRKPPEAGEAPASDRERLRGHLWQTVRKPPVSDRLEVIRIEKGLWKAPTAPRMLKMLIFLTTRVYHDSSGKASFLNSNSVMP